MNRALLSPVHKIALLASLLACNSGPRKIHTSLPKSPIAQATIKPSVVVAAPPVVKRLEKQFERLLPLFGEGLIVADNRIFAKGQMWNFDGTWLGEGDQNYGQVQLLSQFHGERPYQLLHRWRDSEKDSKIESFITV